MIHRLHNLHISWDYSGVASFLCVFTEAAYEECSCESAQRNGGESQDETEAGLYKVMFERKSSRHQSSMFSLISNE